MVSTARRARHQSSWRHRTAAARAAVLVQKTQRGLVIRLHDLPLAKTGRDELRNHLLAALFSPPDEPADSSAAAAAASDRLLEAHGWPLPQLALREGGLWLLSADAIERMRNEAVQAGRSRALDAPYDESPLAPLYARPATTVGASEHDDTLFAGDALCTGRLPECSLGHEPQRMTARGLSSSSSSSTAMAAETQLPAQSAALLKAGMACVLRGAGLFTAGVERWGDADFLSSQLLQPCHTLVSAANRKRFKYWRDEGDARTADRVPGGYRFTPPVKAEHLDIKR